MSITTRVWIAGAGGRLGSALCRRFDRNTGFRLLASDLDVRVEDSFRVGHFADLNHPDVIINCAGLTDVRAPASGSRRKRIRSMPSARAISRSPRGASTPS